MARLRFGTQARRRARVRRLAIGAWVASMVGPLVGVPTGMDLLDRLAPPGRGRGVEASDAAASLLRFRLEAFDARPVERPERRPPKRRRDRRAARRPATRQDVAQIVRSAAGEFGVDGDYLLSVATCESDLDPFAHDGYGYHGLFQFDEQTWAAYGYGSIYDAAAQARTAARLIAAGQAERWPNCA